MNAAKIADRLTSMRTQAAEAMRHAYAPYSKFRVGAALLTDGGDVFVGCNVENASYPAGLCAERVALGAAVAAGQRTFAALAICSEAASPAPPCGICRQALAEFGLDLVVESASPAGPVMRWTLDELLPHPFTPSSLHS